MIKRTSVDSSVNDSDPSDDKGQHFGGLIGLLGGGQPDPVTIEETKFTGEVVSGEKYVGGLVGKTDTELNINNSFSNADYESGADSGGLVGAINGPITIENTYAAGIDGATAPSGEFGGIGGETGVIGDSTKIGDITADSVYFDTDEGVPDIFDVNESKDIPGVETPGASRMKGSSATSTMSDFDFDETWETRTDDFPDLRTFD
jgi:hypothetical protein